MRDLRQQPLSKAARSPGRWRPALLALSLALAVSCATEPDPLDRAEHQAVAKGIFQGVWFYNVTVTDADWENKFTFIGEMSNTHSGKPIKLRWEVTEYRLNGYMVPQHYRDEEGKLVENDQVHQKSLVLSFRIEKHFDIRYRYNPTTRDEIPVLDDNMDRPWDEREYMKVDWTKNLATNIWAPASEDAATGALLRTPAGLESIEFWAADPEGGDDRRVNPKRWRKGGDEVHAINIDLKESFSSKLKSWIELHDKKYMEPSTVRFRHSLLKAKPVEERTYEALHYPDEFFRRFGYFRTEYAVYDKILRRPLESQKRYLANRWDISGDKKIVWHISPDFQESINAGDTQILDIVKEINAEYNKVFREATGRKDDIVVLKENKPMLDADGKQMLRADGSKRWMYELGDLRYPMINITFKQSVRQPLGYGPSMPDPDTGEIIQATANVYAGWAEFVVQRALDQFDVISGNCTLEDIKAGRHFDTKTNKCDRGPAGAADDGPTADNGKSAIVGDLPHSLGSGLFKPKGESFGAAYHRILTPAMRTAYYPKGHIRAIAKKAQVQQSLQMAMPKLKSLHDWHSTHQTALNLKAFQSVKGTDLESGLLPGSNLQSLMPGAPSVDDPDVLAALSPAERLSETALQKARHADIHQHVCKDEPTMFEPAIDAFVAEMKGKPRAEVVKILRRWVYYTTIMHELGHTYGLRHNFRGSVDRRNYAPGYEAAYKKYWDKVEALRATYQKKIEQGDAKAYESYVRAVDAIPSTHDRFASSSIMDYVGDWVDWNTPVRSYDRAALLFAYGKKIEVKDSDGKWQLETYKDGDFEIENPLDLMATPKSGRPVRYYLFCSDERIFDDAFCTRHDRGSTATEITRNFIRRVQTNYLFSNFQRDKTRFEKTRKGYYRRRWLHSYYMYAKPFVQTTVNNIRYKEFWSSIFAGLPKIAAGPEDRNMKPGYFRDGGEDLMRASLLYYYFLLFDVLMRPEYGHYQLARDTKNKLYWDHVKSRYLDDDKVSVFMPAGVGWGFADRWDIQHDPERYKVFLKRIGVELDKTIALEILSIPAVLNKPLRYEKANGTSFWNSLWTNNGHQLWQVVRGLITDNFSHLQNPWCMRCDATCKADPKKNPPTLEVQPIRYLEGLAGTGILTNFPAPTGDNRCGPNSYPVKPALDALFAIKPIFFSIAGASHPWYHNSLADRLDSQVKGGHHRFDIPAGATYAEFVNASGTKTYQAVQTKDGLSISYDLVKTGSEIANRIALVEACLDNKPTASLEGKDGTFNRTCAELKTDCYGNARQSYCDDEGWSTNFTLEPLRYRDLDRIEAMLIMMQDAVDIAGRKEFRVPRYLAGDD